MALLRQYRAGDGFFVRGFVHGAGLCTWQIGKSGLDYLSKRGISQDNDRVGHRDLEYLRAHGLIWTGGSGPSGGSKSSVSPELAQLLADLQEWAITGGLSELTAVLYDRKADQRDRCFSTDFLRWLWRLDEAVELHHFDEISATDFEDLARPALGTLAGPLHGGLVSIGAGPVLWRLARLVGMVACQQQGCTSCPEVWEKEPVLQRLFATLQQFVTDTSSRQSLARGRREHRLLPPSIMWDVDLQHVVAVLPRQRLAGGTRALSWKVTDGQVVDQTITPNVSFDNKEYWVDESNSEALPPADSYRIEVKIPANAASPERIERWQLHLPEDFQKRVLFTSTGTLLDCETELQLPSGDYLALVQGNHVAELFKRRGVRKGELIQLAPVGWHGWQGWKIHLDPGADIGPFDVENNLAAAKWEIEAPPVAAVIWRSSLPVWIGRMPRIYLAHPDALADAILEVKTETQPALNGPEFLRIGIDVKLIHDRSDDRTYIDLATAHALREFYGPILLRCRPLHAVGIAPLTTRFIRLPELRLGYVPDPENPQSVLAVRIESDSPLTRVTPGPGTQILPGREGALVALMRSIEPVRSPTVVARLPKGRGELQIRIPVSRGAWIKSQAAIPSWQPLPITELNLGSVGLNDRLRIELHQTPYVDDGKLLFRISSGIDLLAGEPFRRDQQTNVFEVDLHRWRDAFGIGVPGAVQVRSQSRWIEVARLHGQGHEAPTSPRHLPPRPPILIDLADAVAKGDNEGALVAIAECFSRANRANASVIEADLFPIAAARTVLGMATRRDQLQEAAESLSSLANRSDLPEAGALRRLLLLRSQSLLPSSESWCHDSLRRIQDDVAECPEKDLLTGECYYQYARTVHGTVTACWRSCAEFAEKHLVSAHLRGCEMQYSDAVLLLELARLMQGQVPEHILPRTAGTEPICRNHLPWIEAVRFLGKVIRLPGRGNGVTKEMTALPVNYPQVLRQEDVTLLRIPMAQAQDSNLARLLLAQLQNWSSDQFYAIGLLRARQAKLDGQIEIADTEYARLFEQAESNGPDELLDVVVAERRACKR